MGRPEIDGGFIYHPFQYFAKVTYLLWYAVYVGNEYSKLTMKLQILTSHTACNSAGTNAVNKCEPTISIVTQ